MAVLDWLVFIIGILPLRYGDTSDSFDEPLREGVRAFQAKYKHRVTDGLVGPGTRERFRRGPLKGGILCENGRLISPTGNTSQGVESQNFLCVSFTHDVSGEISK
jgi:hypothetical protein